jgi:hypothetical protein
MRLILIIIALFAGAPALACGTQSVPTTVCIEFAPITGDPEADKCWIVKADLNRLIADFDPRRPRTIADDPLPPITVQEAALRRAIARVSRDCRP